MPPQKTKSVKGGGSYRNLGPTWYLIEHLIAFSAVVSHIEVSKSICKSFMKVGLYIREKLLLSQIKARGAFHPHTYIRICRDDCFGRCQ